MSERKRNIIGYTGAGLALCALAYCASVRDTENPTGLIIDSAAVAAQVMGQDEGIFVPKPDSNAYPRIAAQTPEIPDTLAPGCGEYPDETDDEYLDQQKSLMWPILHDEEGDPMHCPKPYVGYDYIAQRLEERVPVEDRRPVTLVVMDSGINAEHEDWCEGQIDMEVSKTFLDSVSIYTSPLTDEAGHGSIVAGAAAACSGNEIGIASLGRGVYDLASIKVMFPSSWGNMVNHSDVKRAWAYLDDVARQDPERHFVINMSFSGYTYNELMEELVNGFPENVTLIAGSGNDQYGIPSNELSYPAGYERVYPIGASVDEAPDTLCGFSYYSTTHKNFITAPGCFDIWGFNNSNESSFPYKDGLAGTSLSTPIFSGMYGYFLHMFPDMQPEEVMKVIFETSSVVQRSTTREIDGPLKVISPLHAIQELSRLAGYDDLSVPPTPTATLTVTPSPTFTPSPTPSETYTPSPSITPSATVTHPMFSTFLPYTQK